MNLLVVSVVILVCAEEIAGRPSSGCEPLKKPQYGSIICSEAVEGYQQECRFECEGWTDLIGEKVISCDNDIGEWNSSRVSYCEPNFYKCGKGSPFECPRINRDDLEYGLTTRAELDPEELDDLKKVEAMFMIRGSRYKCMPGFCRIKCLCLREKAWASKCRSCKRLKKIRCARSGSLFGR